MVYFRDKAQYSYENLSTGQIQWEYPVQELQAKEVLASDEMDICTTPPPNVNEDIDVVSASNFNGEFDNSF